MTENPFGLTPAGSGQPQDGPHDGPHEGAAGEPVPAAEGGGFDMNALLQQAQAMQQQLVTAQEELAASTVTGTVAGGLVTATVSGTGELVGVEIRTGSFDPDDPEGLADLGDLVVAAYRDAKAQADALAAQKLGPMAGGLGL